MSFLSFCLNTQVYNPANAVIRAQYRATLISTNFLDSKNVLTDTALKKKNNASVFFLLSNYGYSTLNKMLRF